MFFRQDRVPACDGRTDRQTDGIAVGITLQAMRPRCKNKFAMLRVQRSAHVSSTHYNWRYFGRAVTQNAHSNVKFG